MEEGDNVRSDSGPTGEGQEGGDEMDKRATCPENEISVYYGWSSPASPEPDSGGMQEGGDEVDRRMPFPENNLGGSPCANERRSSSDSDSGPTIQVQPGGDQVDKRADFPENDLSGSPSINGRMSSSDFGPTCGIQERGDEVGKRATCPENDVSSSSSVSGRKASVLLNVQFKVKPSSNNQGTSTVFSSTASQPQFNTSDAAAHGEPINVTLKYSPDDLDVSISAQVLKSEESPCQSPAGQKSAPAILSSRGRHSIGTDANQYIIPSMDRQSVGTDANQNILPSGGSHSIGTDANQNFNIQLIRLPVALTKEQNLKTASSQRMETILPVDHSWEQNLKTASHRMETILPVDHSWERNLKTAIQNVETMLPVARTKEHKLRATFQSMSTRFPVAHTREQKLRAAIQSVARQKGAWAVFEDEEVVIGLLNELNQYLTTLDKSSIKKALKEDRYQSVKALGIYFALEKRWIVRSEILSAFDLLVTKDSTAFNVLIMSDLPVDLASAIKHEYMKNEGGQERILAYATVLSSLLNSGHPLQVDHLERINADVIYCFLQLTEGGMKDGCSTALKDTLVNIILAYNLQFGLDELYANKILAALSAFKDPDYLKQKMLLYILNKGVSQFRNQKPIFPSPSCHMVVKLATDILICHKTADFFIDSDLNIILAGVGSYVTELEPGDEKRTAALRLAQLVLSRLDYQHNGIRRVAQILKGIFMEKEPESRKDQKIARRIAKAIEKSSNRSPSYMTGF